MINTMVCAHACVYTYTGMSLRSISHQRITPDILYLCPIDSSSKEGTRVQAGCTAPISKILDILPLFALAIWRLLSTFLL